MKKPPHIISTQTTLILFLILTPILFLTGCAGADTAVEPKSNDTVIYINPYKSECAIDGELQLCYVASLAGSVEFSPYRGDIQNFEYEWGYGYALSGSGDANVFTVEAVDNKSAEPGGVHFPLTITGGNGRIVETDAGVYEFYGEKSFVCSPDAGCDTLGPVIDQEVPITFKFESPENPGDPLILLSWESDTIAAQVGQEPGLLGKTWQLGSLTVSKDNVQPIIAGSQVTAEFTLDESFSKGTISGYGGCNDYKAAVTISGNSITVSDLERGEAQCTNPPGVMDQEQVFTSALTAADSFLVSEDILQINYNSGESVLNLDVSE